MTSQADKDRLLADEVAVEVAEDASKAARAKLAADTAALTVDGAPPPPPPNPTITGFAVTPASVTAGQPVVLSATVANATQVTLDGAPITLPYTHAPTISRSYQIVATGAGTPATSPSIAVTVTAIIPPSGMPAWVPPMNTVGKVSDSSISQVDPGVGPWDTGTGNNRAVFDNWNSGCFASAYSTYGAFVVAGGGDNGRWGNDVYLQDLSVDVPVWARIIDPSPRCANFATFNQVWGEFDDGTPGVGHTYGALGYQPPNMGGGPKGSLIQMVATYYHNVASTGAAHRADLSTHLWSRASSNTCGSVGESTWSLDAARSRFVGMNTGGSAPNSVLRLLGSFVNGVGVHSDVGMHADFTMGGDASSCVGPTLNAFMAFGFYSDGPKVSTYGIRAWDLTTYQPYDLNISGPLPNWAGVGFVWCAANACFYMMSSKPGDGQKLFKLVPPTTWQTGVWISTLITMAGVAVQGGDYNGMWGRLQMNDAAGCLIFANTYATPTYAYRVAPGT